MPPITFQVSAHVDSVPQIAFVRKNTNEAFNTLCFRDVLENHLKDNSLNEDAGFGSSWRTLDRLAPVSQNVFCFAYIHVLENKEITIFE